MTPTLCYITLINDFKYFWGLEVHSTDLTQHCMGSLGGMRINLGPTRYMWNGDLLRQPSVLRKAPAYYLCGVSPKFELHKNYHLAFVAYPGKVIEETRLGVRLKIENALAIPIKEAPYEARQGKSYAFTRCRNWQFANMFEQAKKDGKWKL